MSMDILGKLSQIENQKNILKEYLNLKTIIAYSMFFFATFCSMFAYKYIPLLLGPILGTSEYIFIAILKCATFGATIALISSSCGYSTRGGAKEVGISTTKAVVWSFLAIAVWDFVFAALFYL